MDNFSNCISNLRNAGLVKARFAQVPNTKFVRRFLHLLYEQGLITGFFHVNFKLLRVHISYIGNSSGELALVASFKRISKPSKRRYVTWSQILRYYSGTFIIVSTNQGLITGTEALKRGIGGELLLRRYYFL